MLFDLFLHAPELAIIWLLVILIALTVHEFAHAYISYKKGDHTAENMGRLTLNPLAHIDPFGFLMLLFLGFGWAKPVMFNPYNLKNPKVDAVHIALAGPISNLLLAIITGLGARFFIDVASLPDFNLLIIFLKLLTMVNLSLLFFNLIPIPPLDGSKLIEAIPDRSSLAPARNIIMQYGSQILMMLVLVSIVSNFNVFGFITGPSLFICNSLVGAYCF